VRIREELLGRARMRKFLPQIVAQMYWMGLFRSWGILGRLVI
jgi:hypothetical protein